MLLGHEMTSVWGSGFRVQGLAFGVPRANE
jgi:hypothetical protein